MIPLELSARRVDARVAAGGHDVAADKLASRDERIWPNIVAAVGKCWHSVFDDNSDDAGPVEVVAFHAGLADYPPRWPSWTPDQLLSAFP